MSPNSQHILNTKRHLWKCTSTNGLPKKNCCRVWSVNKIAAEVVGWCFMLDHELCLDFSADLLTTTSTAKKFQTHMRSKTLIIYAGKTWQTCWQQQVPCSAALHGNIKHKQFQIQLWTMVGFLCRLADNSKHWRNIPNIHIYKHMMSYVRMSLITHGGGLSLDGGGPVPRWRGPVPRWCGYILSLFVLLSMFLLLSHGLCHLFCHGVILANLLNKALS